MEHRTIHTGPLSIANDRPFTLLAGPCQIETRDHALRTAETLVKICEELGIGIVYKSSYDKANRTSVAGQRGIGIDEGLKILEEVRDRFGCPIVTDVHSEDQISSVSQAVDIIQIPAFLCRQTDLLLAAGKSGKTINVKKGQFLAPWEMENVAAKIASTGNQNIMLTERGVSFGYNTLITDMRSLPTMAKSGYPVVIDATHSVQQPGGLGGSSGGQREFAPVIARAAVSVGVAAVFIETHEDPDNAPCDGPNMIPLTQMKTLLQTLKKFDEIAKSNPIMIK